MEEIGDGERPQVGQGIAVDFEAEGFRLEAFAAAGGTGGVGTVTAEENPHVHLVGLGFEPGEEASHAIPCARAPERIQFLRC